MAQTKLGSITEAWANIAVGFTINFTANLIILPLFGFHNLTVRNNFIIGILYDNFETSRGGEMVRARLPA